MGIGASESWHLWGSPCGGRLPDSHRLGPNLCESEKVPVRLIPTFSGHGQGLPRHVLPSGPFLLAAAVALWQNVLWPFLANAPSVSGSAAPILLGQAPAVLGIAV